MLRVLSAYSADQLDDSELRGAAIMFVLLRGRLEAVKEADTAEDEGQARIARILRTALAYVEELERIGDVDDDVERDDDDDDEEKEEEDEELIEDEEKPATP